MMATRASLRHLEPIKSGRERPPFSRAQFRFQALAPSEIGVSPSINDALLAADIKIALDTLTEREAQVIRMRFGIGGEVEHTLEEVGQAFKVSQERIRQIEGKALRKLRLPKISTVLRSYIKGEP